jgi:hypothetical protein
MRSELIELNLLNRERLADTSKQRRARFHGPDRSGSGAKNRAS